MYLQKCGTPPEFPCVCTQQINLFRGTTLFAYREEACANVYSDSEACLHVNVCQFLLSVGLRQWSTFGVGNL